MIIFGLQLLECQMLENHRLQMRYLQKEQSIVTPIAGTTRDSIDSQFIWYGKNITIVDTAGMRKARQGY